MVALGAAVGKPKPPEGAAAGVPAVFDNPGKYIFEKNPKYENSFNENHN